MPQASTTDLLAKFSSSEVWELMLKLAEALGTMTDQERCILYSGMLTKQMEEMSLDDLLEVRNLLKSVNSPVLGALEGELLRRSPTDRGII